MRVPASTSNLGAGFDCVGLAVDRWLAAAVVVHDRAAPAGSPPHVEMRREGTLAGLAVAPHEDLAYAGFTAACALGGRPVPGQLAFTMRSEIPVARGLGSSAAALVAGAALANAALGLGCSPAELADVCAGLEGHPDNVAPAVFGGAVLGVPRSTGNEPTHYAYSPLRVHESLAFAFAVPDFHLTTNAARAILPTTISHQHAVAAAAKSAALVQGLATGDASLITYALDDVLHVPYRRALVAGYTSVADAAVGAGAFGATLSGSGPTMMAVAPHEAAGRVAAAMAEAWRATGAETRTFVQRRPAAACLRDAANHVHQA